MPLDFYMLDRWSKNNFKAAVGAILYRWVRSSSHYYSPEPSWRYALGSLVLLTDRSKLINAKKESITSLCMLQLHRRLRLPPVELVTRQT